MSFFDKLGEIGFATNQFNYTAWSATKTIPASPQYPFSLATNWIGWVYMGTENFTPTNWFYLIGVEVKYW